MAVLKFRLYFEEDDSIYRDVAIKPTQTFLQLHQVLLKAYEFDRKHQATFSRSNDNVLHRRFLVVESDVLSKDQVGAIFGFLRNDVGMPLRAIVDTGGKSLHGWFDFPKRTVFEELQIVLPQLGCDPGLFKPSQPCRLPGVRRGDQYQRLIWIGEGGRA